MVLRFRLCLRVGFPLYLLEEAVIIFRMLVDVGLMKLRWLVGSKFLKNYPKIYTFMIISGKSRFFMFMMKVWIMVKKVFFIVWSLESKVCFMRIIIMRRDNLRKF